MGRRTDVFLCVVGATCGKINLGEDCAIGRSVAALRPDEAALDQFYLHYFLEGVVELLRGGSLGAAQTVISKEMIGRLPIPLPPLEEQRRIVAVLDEAFEGLARARANIEANLADAKELEQALIDWTFDQLDAEDAVPLIDLCGDRGVTYGVIKLGNHIEDGVPCLRTSNVRPSRIDIQAMKRITPTLSQEYSRTILRGGELLVAVRGTLGGVAVADPTMAGWNVSREVAMVDLRQESCEAEFVALYVRSRPAMEWLTGVVTGTAHKGINLTDLRKLPIPLPSRDKQLSAVREISNMRARQDEGRQTIIAQLADLDALRQSLLARAFRGELT
jgi:type I restriction enzyme S subunit